MLCIAKDFVARFPSKVLEEGTGVPRIVSLERDTMTRGLKNVSGPHVNISFAGAAGSSISSRCMNVEVPLNGLGNGFA